jgi:lipooligosaccharide transport system permease protein
MTAVHVEPPLERRVSDGRGRLPTRRTLAVLERNVMVYRRAPLILFSGFFEPVFYLLSLSIGVSRLVGDVTVDGRKISYVSFVAPALLATSAMNGAFFESTYQLFIKLIDGKTYQGMLATPVSVRDMAAGEVAWAIFRGLIYSIGFLVMAVALGAIDSAWAVLALPGALLICAAFAAAGQVLTSFMRTLNDMDFVALITQPLFLCSATFFPLSTYPAWAERVVAITPLYQGVALERALTTGTPDLSTVGHAAYLVVMGVVALAVSSRRLTRQLTH